MSAINGRNNIDFVINHLLKETKRIFGEVATIDKLDYLRFCLEDMLLNLSLNSNPGMVNIFPNNILSDEMIAALIASGISPDGSIPNNDFYKKIYLLNDNYTYNYAIQQLKTASASRFKDEVSTLLTQNMQIPTDINGIEFYATQTMPKLVELGLISNEIFCGFIPANHREFIDIGLQFGNYSNAMNFYSQYGLTDTLACSICSMIYSQNGPKKRYPFIVKEALRMMAYIDMNIHVHGAVITPTTRKVVEKTLQTIEAAKILDKDLIEPFSQRFNEVVIPLLGETSMHRYTSEENRRRFCRVGNIINFNLIKPE